MGKKFFITERTYSAFKKFPRDVSYRRKKCFPFVQDNNLHNAEVIQLMFFNFSHNAITSKHCEICS